MTLKEKVEKTKLPNATVVSIIILPAISSSYHRATLTMLIDSMIVYGVYLNHSNENGFWLSWPCDSVSGNSATYPQDRQAEAVVTNTAVMAYADKTKKYTKTQVTK